MGKTEPKIDQKAKKEAKDLAVLDFFPFRTWQCCNAIDQGLILLFIIRRISLDLCDDTIHPAMSGISRRRAPVCLLALFRSTTASVRYLTAQCTSN